MNTSSPLHRCVVALALGMAVAGFLITTRLLQGSAQDVGLVSHADRMHGYASTHLSRLTHARSKSAWLLPPGGTATGPGVTSATAAGCSTDAALLDENRELRRQIAALTRVAGIDSDSASTQQQPTSKSTTLGLHTPSNTAGVVLDYTKHHQGVPGCRPLCRPEYHTMLFAGRWQTVGPGGEHDDYTGRPPCCPDYIPKQGELSDAEHEACGFGVGAEAVVRLGGVGGTARNRRPNIRAAPQSPRTRTTPGGLHPTAPSLGGPVRSSAGCSAPGPSWWWATRRSTRPSGRFTTLSCMTKVGAKPGSFSAGPTR